jgi:hypothetical protein
MATQHTAAMKKYEDHDQKIDRFESAISEGGLIHTGREAVDLLIAVTKDQEGSLSYIQHYLTAGIANRLQESMNISPIKPTEDND